MTPPLHIVLLSGWSGSGKDTIGRLLTTHKGFKRYAFADPVKDQAAKRYGFERGLADTPEGKETAVPAQNFLMPAGRTVRDWVIHHGEERKRIDGAGVWAAAIAARIQADRLEAGGSAPFRAVITDWRFPEELVELQRRLPGAEFWPVRLVRGGQRVSPVGSMTEYSLSGFPMPGFDALADEKKLFAYLGLEA
jgi:hypothetical protein